MKFQFGNVVVVNGHMIGLIVKSWSNGSYDVYVRLYSDIIPFKEKDIKHFVYSKELSEDEVGFY